MFCVFFSIVSYYLCNLPCYVCLAASPYKHVPCGNVKFVCDKVVSDCLKTAFRIIAVTKKDWANVPLSKSHLALFCCGTN